MPNQEVYLIDADGRRLPPGSVGELVVRGSHVMRGYWRRPEETAQRLKSGPYPGERVLHTGDVFHMDEDGYLYFIGRSDDIIKSRGEKVSPKEVIQGNQKKITEPVLVAANRRLRSLGVHLVDVRIMQVGIKSQWIDYLPFGKKTDEHRLFFGRQK